MGGDALILRVTLEKLLRFRAVILRNGTALLLRVKKQFVIRQGAC